MLNTRWRIKHDEIMKTNICTLMAAMAIVITFTALTACSDDDEKTSTIKTDKAGYFWLKNLRTHEGTGTSKSDRGDGTLVLVSDNKVITCQQGDTLVLSFTPEDKYSDAKYHFEQCNFLDNTTQVNETIYTAELALGEHNLAAKSICKIEGYDLSASKSFKFNVGRKEITDMNAGTFLISNLSTGEVVSEQYYSCFAGDTLKVLFQPKPQFASVPFKIEAGYFDKLNDSLFVVRDLKTLREGGVSVGKDVDFQTVYNQNDSTLGAKRNLIMITWVEYADITYTLNVSPDLLNFISASISYSDDTAFEKTINLKEEDWTMEHVEIDGESLDMACFRLPMHYDKLDKDYYFKVMYAKKDGVILSKDVYEFWYGLSLGPATIAGEPSVNISIGISVGGNGNEVKSEEVSDYLEKLINNPDIVKIHLDKRNRRISTIK